MKRANKGARRELRLALSRTRAAITHMQWAESVQHLPPKLRDRVKFTRRDMHLQEASLCRLLRDLK
jgi:hypothetical protein